MKQVPFVLALVPLASCVVHIHIHESPHAAAAAHAAPHASGASVASGVVSGVVVDDHGRPVEAHVAAVGDSGSVSMGTQDDGRFELSGLHWKDFTLHASTDDMRIAVAPDVRGGTGGIQLVVRPAAAITIDLQGLESTRCAIFHDHARIEDFTLRAGKPALVVVPAGEVLVRLYEGAKVHAEKTIPIDVGERRDIVFELGGR